MTETKRPAGLDGLRGVAALIVVFRHTNNAVVMPMEARQALIEGPLASFSTPRVPYNSFLC